MNVQDEKMTQINKVAQEVINLSRDGILMNLRFMDLALSKFPVESKSETGRHLYTGTMLYYDPVRLLRQVKKEKNYASRLYLHSMLHVVFYHAFDINNKERELWDLACDIAVENVIYDMNLHIMRLSTDDAMEQRLKLLKKQAGGLSAQKIYKCFRIDGISDEAKDEWHKLTYRDEHIFWDIKEELKLSGEEWKKVAERIKADLKSFSKGKNNDSIEENIKEAVKEKYDYVSFLKKFMVMGETVSVNDDEFDYVYYTYGLKLYDNMPLIEPLEYRDENKIKDFVIAIDTSASCRGEIVEAFLRKTYSIMQSRESFFSKINVHIIQCDNEVRSDTKITSSEDFEDFMHNGKLVGFGATDFRPVFEYVDELVKNGEFTDLKGLIYFTDGYGTFPTRMPQYDTAFVFINRVDENIKVPPFAIKIVLEDEDVEEFRRKP